MPDLPPITEMGRLNDLELQMLAQYNSERSRGLVHTQEWQECMAELQRRFDATSHWRDPGKTEKSFWRFGRA